MANPSDLNTAIARGVAEAIDVLERAAKVVDDEWQRVSTTVAESDTVPDQVKQAISQLDDAAAAMRREAATVADELPQNLANGVEEVVAFFGRMGDSCAGSSEPASTEVVPAEPPAPKPTRPVSKSKSSATSKAKPATRQKAKAKPATKQKAKAKAKPATTSKAKSKGSATSKSKAKTRSKAKPAAKSKAKSSSKSSGGKTSTKRTGSAKDKPDS